MGNNIIPLLRGHILWKNPLIFVQTAVAYFRISVQQIMAVVIHQRLQKFVVLQAQGNGSFHDLPCGMMLTVKFFF